MSSPAPDKECDTGSAHLLRMALRRRALAYDVANITSFDLERWHQSLFDRLNYELPPGYSSPSMAQLIAGLSGCWFPRRPVPS